jgi:hypothetical protein
MHPLKAKILDFIGLLSPSDKRLVFTPDEFCLDQTVYKLSNPIGYLVVYVPSMLYKYLLVEEALKFQSPAVFKSLLDLIKYIDNSKSEYRTSLTIKEKY